MHFTCITVTLHGSYAGKIDVFVLEIAILPGKMLKKAKSMVLKRSGVPVERPLSQQKSFQAIRRLPNAAKKGSRRRPRRALGAPSDAPGALKTWKKCQKYIQKTRIFPF